MFDPLIVLWLSMRLHFSLYRKLHEQFGLRTTNMIVLLIGLIFISLLVFLNLNFAADGGKYESSDFMTLWLGGKALVHGADLYDPQAWEAILLNIAPGYHDNPIYIFPLPTAILFIPFSLLPVRLSGALWLLLNELLLVSFFAWVISQTEYKKNLSSVSLIALLVATYHPLIIIIHSGQYNLFMFFLIASSFLLIRKKTELVGGAIIALLILRPNPVIYFLPVMLIWAMVQKRWRILVGFGTFILLLLSVSELIEPGWTIAWLKYTIGDQGKLYTYGQISPTLWGMLVDFGASWDPLLRNSVYSFVAILLCLAGIRLTFLKAIPLDLLISILITISLCITPYAWNYDHILLLFPLAYLIMSQKNRSPQSQRIVILMVILTYSIIPYSLRYIAITRGIDTLSGLLPFAVLSVLSIAANLTRNSNISNTNSSWLAEI